MTAKFLECECCGFLAVIPRKDAHDDLVCPFCRKAECDHGGRFEEIDRKTFDDRVADV